MNRLLAISLGKGTCGGCHVPYTVVTLLRVDEQYPIIEVKTKQKAEIWLRNVVAVLEKNQLPDGSWDRDWGKTGEKGMLYNRLVRKLEQFAGIVEKYGRFYLTKTPIFSIFTFPDKSNDPVLDKTTVIGHHLEWLALLPESFDVPKKMIQKAIVAVTEQIEQLPPVEKRSFKTVLPCSHAAKALTLGVLH